MNREIPQRLDDERRLRVLLVEDNPDDEALLARALRKNGYDLDMVRVETAEAMREALEAREWDIVISDYSLPTFTGLGALEVLKGSGKILPFIIVSGTIGEETAVEALLAGAHDFIVKGRLARLVPAIERGIANAAVRRERAATEAAFRVSEAKYRTIVEMAQEGIWVADGEGQTTFVNGAMARMLGTTREDMLGRPVADFVHEDHRELARQQIREGTTMFQRDIRLVRADGEDCWGMVTAGPVGGQAGDYQGSLAMVADVTEQRRLREQLMLADRMASVGTIAAGVAHEINNPLAAVLTNLQMALDDPGLPRGGATEMLREALEAAEHLRAIVRDLKVFSRDGFEEVRGPVDLHKVVESACRMARSELRHRARLELDLGPIPWVTANENRLGQVFLNLLVNAAQAIPEGDASRHEVRVVTRTDREGRAVVEVRDTGCGMPPSVLARLFTPFYTTKPIGVGTGLGLSICHRIVEALGGRLEVESDVGRGSVFRVRLAPGPAPAAAEVAPVVMAPTVTAGRGRVLVVDDEQLIVRMLKRLIGARHDVTALLASSEALATLERGEQFDVILCDLMMPQMTGMELYERLLVTRPEQASRMVFMTGGAFTARAQAFLLDSRNERLEKPFDWPTVEAVLERVMKRPR